MPKRAAGSHAPAGLWQMPEVWCPLRDTTHVALVWPLEAGRSLSRQSSAVRDAFNRLRELIEACGPVEMIPQKTRVVFLTRMRFAAAMPRSVWLDGHLNLSREISDPRFTKVVRYGPTTYTHSFRARDASFFDATFAAFVRESYIRGRQEHARSDSPSEA